MNEPRNSPDTDLDKLTRLKALAWLSTPELRLLTGALALTSFKKHQIILHDTAPAAQAHILLKGIARVTCQNAHEQRVTVALLAPGPIPEFPALPLSQADFQCEAYGDCRVGSLNWSAFNSITPHGSEWAFQKFHEHDLQQWYRLLLRNSGFLNLGLHDRIANALLELASTFGIRESRGMLLSASFSHQDIANLVGASRPRVSEHLAQFEQQHLIIRQGRQLIVRVDQIEHWQN